jgi:hypothetical protein
LLFMVIERFRDGSGKAVYQRFAERGRMIPSGVRFVDSWVDTANARCFQLMDCAREEDLQPWLDAWSDLVDFEVAAVTDSATAAERVKH